MTDPKQVAPDGRLEDESDAPLEQIEDLELDDDGSADVRGGCRKAGEKPLE